MSNHATHAQAIDTIHRLLVKDHVSLGGLPEYDRGVALALVWSGLPDAQAWSEREVNDVLKARLAGAGACLGVDHVELRRWMVDLGWLQRDDYGRQYRRVAMVSLRPALAMLAHEMSGQDWDAVARHLRLDRAESKARRRAAWEQQQVGARA